MANIRRAKRKKGFTVLDNEGIGHPDITYQATGLWAFVMSKPDGWEINVRHLVSQKGNGDRRKEGRDSIYSAIHELISVGLVVKTKPIRQSDGTFSGGGFDFYDSPQQIHSLPDTALPDTALPDTALPDTALPDTAKTDAYINTEFKQILNKTNTEGINIPARENPQKNLDALSNKSETVPTWEHFRKSFTVDAEQQKRHLSLVKKQAETPHQVVKRLISEQCNAEEFINLQKESMKSWWKDGRVTEGTVLERFAKQLRFYPTDGEQERAEKIAVVKEKIKTRVEELGLDSKSAAQQAQQAASSVSFDELLTRYQKNPQILDLSPAAFYREFGAELDVFTRKLFRQGVF